MTPEDRIQKLELYHEGYANIVDALSQFPRDMWSYKPAPDAWCIKEMVIHILDSDINSYVRLCKAIAEPGGPVAAYDGDKWAQALHYADQNIDEALTLLQWMRSRIYKLLQALPEETWANTYDHPEKGVQSLDDWLDTYANHVNEHIDQSWDMYREWVQQDW
jgi:hypothetical protein